jgi:hypothetical protein
MGRYTKTGALKLPSGKERLTGPSDDTISMARSEAAYDSDAADFVEKIDKRNARLNQKYADRKKPSIGSFRTKGKQNLLEGQTTRTKRSGAALLKSIKRRMLKGIPGNRNKSY